jgi:hypothetical protein
MEQEGMCPKCGEIIKTEFQFYRSYSKSDTVTLPCGCEIQALIDIDIPF